jgi:hypothetical protein
MILFSVGCEVLTAVLMKSSVVWGSFACCLLLADFLLGLLFSPEDGSIMFL